MSNRRSNRMQMCPIYADFKHFRRRKRKNFALSCKVSSIMRAKVLSIMRMKQGE